MMKFFFQKKAQPVPQKMINMIFLSLIVILSLTAGYYYTQYELLQKRFVELENTKLDLIEIPVTPLEEEKT